MSGDNRPEVRDPKWLAKIKVSVPYAVAVAIGVLLTQLGNVADGIGKIYDRFRAPDAFVLAENTAKSNFSDQFAQRAWRRLFWADNFRARVTASAPIADIDASWKSYIEAVADWNANLMISIVGLERFYDRRRSEQLEGAIQDLFRELDENLAALRRSDSVKALRAGSQPTVDQQEQIARQAKDAKDVSDKLKRELYTLVRCFAPADRQKNYCA